MSFFRRNKDAPLIPPVAEPKPDPYASAPNARQPSSDPYAKPSSDPYAKSKPSGGGDPYAPTAQGRLGAYQKDAPNPADAARNELFSGYNAPEKPKGDRKYGYEGREMEEDFDEDEEVEGIKQEMRGLKNESLASTRNALRLAREAEENARGTVAKLADQSERIANSSATSIWPKPTTYERKIKPRN